MPRVHGSGCQPQHRSQRTSVGSASLRVSHQRTVPSLLAVIASVPVLPCSQATSYTGSLPAAPHPRSLGTVRNRLLVRPAHGNRQACGVRVWGCAAPVAVLDGRRVAGGGPAAHVEHRKLPVVAAGADHAGVLQQHACISWPQTR